MGALIHWAVRRLLPFLALAGLGSAPAIAAPDPDLGRYVAGASRRFAMPEAWIWRVIALESGGRTSVGGRPIRSAKGAMGVMQLMPPTWARMRAAYGLGDDPDDPRDNILAGTAYLRLMYERFGYPGLFGAYNAGPERYAAYLGGARPLPRETIAYLASAAASQARRPSGRTDALPAPPAAPPTLFAISRSLPEPAADRAPPRGGEANPLIVIRRD